MTSVHSPLEIDRTKCGEVFRLVGNQIMFSCMLCYEEIDDANQFQTHLLQHFQHIIVNIKIEKQNERNIENSFEDDKDEILRSIDDDNDTILLDPAMTINDIVDTRLQCDVCLKTFSSRGSVARHKRNVHFKESNVNTSDIHVKDCSEPAATVNELQCELCLRTFSCRRSTVRHKRNIHFFKGSFLNPCDNDEKQGHHALQHIEPLPKVTANEIEKLNVNEIEKPKENIENCFEDEILHSIDDDNDIINLLERETMNDINDIRLQCDVCLKTFSSRGSVARHKRNVHFQEPSDIHVKDSSEPAATVNQLQCDICVKTFSSRGSVARHKRNIHCVNEENRDHYALQHLEQPKENIENCFDDEILQSIDDNNDIIFIEPVPMIVDNKDPELQCDICMKKFASRGGVKRHKRERHFKDCIKPAPVTHDSSSSSYAKLQCDICLKKFAKRSSVNRHKREVHLIIENSNMSSNAPELPIKCDICLKSFPNYTAIESHMKQTHGKKTLSINGKTTARHFKNQTLCSNETRTTKYTCDLCNCGYDDRRDFVTHLRKHTIVSSAKKLKCKLCSLEVATKSHLNYHFQLNHAYSFMCKNCQMRFKSYDLLEKHEKNSCRFVGQEQCEKIMANQMLSCQICHIDDFQCIGLKRKHFIDIHKYQPKSTKEQCTQCSAIFSTADELNEHEPLHLLANLPKCMHCGETFQYQSDLLNHLARKSTADDDNLLPLEENVEKTLACNLCNRKFATINALHRHLCYPTPILQCNFCSFSSRHELAFKTHVYKQHTGESPFKCEICSKTYADNSYLTIHARIHSGEKTHVCMICGMSFYMKSKLTTHMKDKHNEDKKFNCDICGKGYSKRLSIIGHLNRHADFREFKCLAPNCDKAYYSKTEWRMHRSKKHKLARDGQK